MDFKKNKNLILGVVALCAVIGILLGVYFGTRGKPVPEVPAPSGTGTVPTGNTEDTQPGVPSFTVLVVHKDGTEKEFTYQTTIPYLGAALDEEGLIGDNNNGLYATVDGETADWNVDQGWWKVLIGDTEATVGLNDIPVQNGQVYKLVYTVGF